MATEAVFGTWLTVVPEATYAVCWKTWSSAEPPAGGRVPELLSQVQKSRLGATNVSSPHEPSGKVEFSHYPWISTSPFLLTSPSLFLMDPLSPIELYKRAAITKIEVVLIVFVCFNLLLF